MTSNPNTLGVVNSDGSAGSAVAASTSAAVGVMSTSAVGDTSVANASVFAGPIVSGTNANLSVSVFAADPNSNAANNNNSGDDMAPDLADSNASDSSDSDSDWDSDSDADSDSDPEDGFALKKFSRSNVNLVNDHLVRDDASLTDIVRSLISGGLDHSAKVEAMTIVAHNLSIGRLEAIHAVLQEPIVPVLIRWAAKVNRLQCLALFCLHNIAAGLTKHTRKLVEHDAVPVLIELLKSPLNMVKLLSISALGNIAAGDRGCRKEILKSNGIIPLILVLNERDEYTFKSVNQTLFNLFRKKIPSSVNIKLLVQGVILAYLKPLVLHALDHDIISEDEKLVARTSLQILVCFINTPDFYPFIGVDTYQHVPKFLSIDDLELTLIALHVIKNCTDGSMKKVLRDKHVLTRLRTLLVADNAPVLLLRGEVCEAIFMFTIGEPNYSQDVTGQLLLDVLNVMNDTHERAIKCSCAKTIFNVTCGGLELIMSLPLQACIQQLCFFFLHTDDVELLHLSLGAILNFCQDGQTKDNIDTIGELIAEYNVGDLIASDRLESLEDTSQDPKIRKLAEDILNQLYLE